jgi:hypothetical protein
MELSFDTLADDVRDFFVRTGNEAGVRELLGMLKPSVHLSRWYDDDSGRTGRKCVAIDWIDEVNGLGWHLIGAERKHTIGVLPVDELHGLVHEALTEYGRIMTIEEYDLYRQREADRQHGGVIAALRLAEKPGSPEWFDAIHHTIERNGLLLSDECRAERYAEARLFGAQSVEGYYSDNDSISSRCGELQQAFDYCCQQFPLEYLRWKNR